MDGAVCRYQGRHRINAGSESGQTKSVQPEKNEDGGPGAEQRLTPQSSSRTTSVYTAESNRRPKETGREDVFPMRFSTRIAILAVLSTAISSLPLTAQSNPVATCDFTYFQVEQGPTPGIGGINDSDVVSGTVQAGEYLNAFIKPPDGAATVFEVNGQPAQASKINDQGAVVGTYYPTQQSPETGFIWFNGKVTALNGPEGANGTAAHGINNSGEVVGWYDSGDAVQKGFIYRNGAYTTFYHSGWNFMQAEGVNKQGVIVGSYLDNSNIMHGFLYANGKFTTLDFPGASNTDALGINDSGEIVGWYVPSGQASSQGFIYVNGEYSELEVNGQPSISINAVNNKGDIYGISLGKSWIGKNCQ
jgi:probable HAF family extracellular repeat protein